jgi:hypothetical protein
MDILQKLAQRIRPVVRSVHLGLIGVLIIEDLVKPIHKDV